MKSSQTTTKYVKNKDTQKIKDPKAKGEKGVESQVYTMRASSEDENDDASEASIQEYVNLPHMADGHGRLDSTMSLEMDKTN